MASYTGAGASFTRTQMLAWFYAGVLPRVLHPITSSSNTICNQLIGEPFIDSNRDAVAKYKQQNRSREIQYYAVSTQETDDSGSFFGIPFIDYAVPQ